MPNTLPLIIKVAAFILLVCLSTFVAYVAVALAEDTESTALATQSAYAQAVGTAAYEKKSMRNAHDPPHVTERSNPMTKTTLLPLCPHCHARVHDGEWCECQNVEINADAIPPEERRIIASSLLSTIRAAFEDPEFATGFEAWKREQNKGVT